MLVCKNCKKKFEPKNRNYKQKFCSWSCYLSSIEKNGGNRKRNRKISVCNICGKKFEHWAGRNAKYCSRECWAKRNPPVLFYCLNCGKEFWDYKINRENNVFCSNSCANSFNQRGDKCKFWKGGKTPLSKILRSRTEYLNWRTEVFKRDDYTCQDCGVKSGNGKKVYLQAHHIKEFSKYPEKMYEISNGITLCKNCHLLRHFHKF